MQKQKMAKKRQERKNNYQIFYHLVLSCIAFATIENRYCVCVCCCFLLLCVCFVSLLFWGGLFLFRFLTEAPFWPGGGSVVIYKIFVKV